MFLHPVTVRGREFFRGFFLQARDAETNEWIGSWQDSQNTKTIPECASITHGDPRDKEGANLIWNAPQHKSGRVYFTYVLNAICSIWRFSFLHSILWRSCTVVNSSVKLRLHVYDSAHLRSFHFLCVCC